MKRCGFNVAVGLLAFSIAGYADSGEKIKSTEKSEAAPAKAEKKAPKSQADAVLDMLTKKGLLTPLEADTVRDDISKLGPEGGDGMKMKVGSWIKELKLYGDARLRYEFREGQSAVFNSPTAVRPDVFNAFRGAPTAGAGSDSLNRERWRYRVRFGTILSQELGH